MKLTVFDDGVQSDLDLDLAVITIGRAKDNAVRLSSTRVSRHHARIESQGGAPWILDLGSANGIEVNGESVDRCMLRSGDEVSLGLGVRLVLGDDVPGGEQQETEEEVGLRTLTGEAYRERENLRVFARITRELAARTELQPLLELIVDSAVSLVGGERGFILLREDRAPGASAPDAARSMSVSVARSFDHTNVAVPRTRLSMGIADRVVREGKPVLSVDASEDQRFADMASVENLRLRSVVCLPILTEGTGGEEVEGILYVDNRLQSGAFDQEDLDLLEMLAAQASIAIRNARLLETLRSRNHHLDLSRQQIEGLNEQLGRKVRDREGELAVVRAELGRARGRHDYKSIVGASDAMAAVFKQVDRIVESDLPVLIQGESGTGKELIAHAVHHNGPRQKKALVTENCAALPDTLLESELFGHVRGAFTGAFQSKRGILEQANGGTLFLDEIGDMSPDLQKKLLRVLQDGEFRVLGSTRNVTVDVRILAASNRDLKEMVSQGTFRKDLFYRIAVLTVDLPPLRKRGGDVPLLAEHMLARAAREAGRAAPTLSSEALACIVNHSWPGNVRELENEMRRLVVLVREEVQLEDLSPAVQQGGEEALMGGEVPQLVSAVAEVEIRTIRRALRASNGMKSPAAELLGISRYSLQRKIQKYGLGDDPQ
jgi:transcriptional regulator with GAF, ATPase, and Fis domain